jgi:hypothetical protein
MTTNKMKLNEIETAAENGATQEQLESMLSQKMGKPVGRFISNEARRLLKKPWRYTGKSAKEELQEKASEREWRSNR